MTREIKTRFGWGWLKFNRKVYFRSLTSLFFLLSVLVCLSNDNLAIAKPSSFLKSLPKLDYPKNPSEGVLIATVPWKAVTLMVDGVPSKDKTPFKNWSYNAIPLTINLFKNWSLKEEAARFGPGYLRLDQKGHLYFFYGATIFIFDIKNQSVKYVGNLLEKESGSPVDLEMYPNGEIGFLVRDNKSFGDDSVLYVRKSLKGDLIKERRIVPKEMAEHQLSKWTLSQGDIYYGKHGINEKIDSESNLIDSDKNEIGNKVWEFTKEENRQIVKLVEKEVSHLFAGPFVPLVEIKDSEYYWADGVFDGRDKVEVVYVRNKNGNYKIYVFPPQFKFCRYVDPDGNFYCQVDTPNALEVYKYVVNW